MPFTATDNLGIKGDIVLLETLFSAKSDPNNALSFYGKEPTGLQENVLYTAELSKINKKDKAQVRHVVVTNLAIYTFAPKKLKKILLRMGIGDVDRVAKAKGSLRVLVCGWEHCQCNNLLLDFKTAKERDVFVESVVEAFHSFTTSKPPVVELASGVVDSLREKEPTNMSPDDLAASYHRRGSSLFGKRGAKLRTLASGLNQGGGSGGAGGKGALLPKTSGLSVEKANSTIEDLVSLIKAISGKTMDNNQLTDTVSRWPTSTPVDSVRLVAECVLNPEMARTVMWWLVTAEAWGRQALDNTLTLIRWHTSDDSPVCRGWMVRTLFSLCSGFTDGDLFTEELIENGGFDGFFLSSFIGMKKAPALPPDVKALTPFDAEGGSDSRSRKGSGADKISRSRIGSLVSGSAAQGTEDAIAQCVSRPLSFRLTMESYHALLEILLGSPWKPSDGDGTVEPFGKPITRPETIPIIMRLLPSADWQVKKQALQDINVLLIRREENFPCFLQQSTWMTWFIPLLVGIPREPDSRTEDQAEYLKYVLNVYAMLFYHIFSKEGSIDKKFEQFFHQLTLQGGWSDPTVGVARSILGSVLMKVGNGCDTWKREFKAPEWVSIFKLLTLVEDFIFFRPTEGEDVASLMEQEGREPPLVDIPIQQLHPFSCPRIAAAGSGLISRKNPGIHINMQTGAPADLKLAQGTVKVLERLGLSGDSGQNLNHLGKEGKEKHQVGNRLVVVFREIVKFFRECDNLDTEAKQSEMITKLSKFLEKRSKMRGAGFLSKSGGKKNIVKSLQASLLRQQAQRTVRKQVRSEARKVEKTVVVVQEEAEVEEEEVQNNQGEVGRRLRGNVTQAAAAAPNAPKSADEAAKAALEAVSADGEVAVEDKKEEEAKGEDETADTWDLKVENEALCAKCEQPLLDDDGVGAMGKMYHVECFCCCECNEPFRNNPFYRRKGQVYCKKDYLRKFTKSVCAGCLKPFKKGDQAMEACGRMYHVDHFQCFSCNKPIGEDVDYFENENQPYCHDCNNRIFLRCPGCDQAVSEADDGVAACGSNWHKECFTCCVCHEPFEAGKYFTKDIDDGKGELPYCEKHYIERFGSRCYSCQKPIHDKGLVACGHSWHEEHFRCTHCKCEFENGAYYEQDGLPYCQNDYLELFAERCARCTKPISGECYNAMGKKFHPECFTCKECNASFPDGAFFEEDGHPYCESDFKRLFCKRCHLCNDPILGERLEVNGISFHEECVTCSVCATPLKEKVFMDDNKVLFCQAHYTPMTEFTCHKCGLGIQSGEGLQALDKKWHSACFACTTCGLNFAESNENFFPHEGRPYCTKCFADVAGDPCGICGKGVLSDAMMLGEMKVHGACIACATCGVDLRGEKFHPPRDGKLYCAPHYMDKFAEKCTTCAKPLTGPMMAVLGRKYHPECLICFICEGPLSGQMANVQGWPACLDCARKPLPEAAQQFIDNKKKEEAEAAAAKADVGKDVTENGTVKQEEKVPDADAPEGPLPEGWVESEEDGKTFYLHAATGMWQWTHPSKGITLDLPEGWEKKGVGAKAQYVWTATGNVQDAHPALGVTLPLPEGWMEDVEDGYIYYLHTETGLWQYQHPALGIDIEVPEGWVQGEEDGKTFYVHEETGWWQYQHPCFGVVEEE